MTTTTERLTERCVPLVYGARKIVFAVLMLITAVLGYHALKLKPDAGFEKLVPIDHPYMQVFRQYQKSFGGANLVSVALVLKPEAKGDIYDEHFLGALKQATDDVFFLPGVDRSRVTSLFTRGVRYVEIVEGGLASGDVIPRDYKPSDAMFARIRGNVAKAGLQGRLVANDQRGALITAELLEHDPAT